MVNKDPARGTLQSFVSGVTYSTSSLGNLEFCQVRLINLLNLPAARGKTLSFLAERTGALAGTVP